MLKIGTNNIFLAPMAGITDTAFRHMAIEQGAGFTYTEMVSAKGLKYGSEKTASLISFAENERTIGVQLFSSDTDAIKSSIESLQALYRARIALFDINMGCPAKKITGNGEGCALMRDPERASRLIRAAADISCVPVTVKFRKGWDETTANAVDFARMAEQSGAAAVAVHGRTRQQFYSGHSDPRVAEQVKKAVRIPVIASGDIFSARDAARLFEQTGCDAVMVARGALGNPFIFREINYFLRTGHELPSAALDEKAKALLKQAELACAAKGERVAMRQIRKHAAWYFKGCRGAARLRDASTQLTTLEDLKQLIRSALELHKKGDENGG